MAEAAQRSTAETLERAARAIEAEFDVALGSPQRVAAACAVLREARDRWEEEAFADRLESLARLLPGRTGPLVLPLFELIEQAAGFSRQPRRLIQHLLRAAPAGLADRALDLLLSMVLEGRLAREAATLAMLAAVADEGGPPGGRAGLEKIARLFGDLALEILLDAHADAATRRLAARVLDLPGRPPEAAAAESLLGQTAYPFLAPYLDYTRATHEDLLALTASGDGLAVALSSLHSAEDICGTPLLRDLIAGIGWPALNLGLDVRHVVGLSIGGGIPLLLAPAEAALFDGCPGAERVFERVVAVAQGTRADASGSSANSDRRVARFRASNLRHANLLGEFLDLAPLTVDRVNKLVDEVRELVHDFVELFADQSDECCGVQAACDAIASSIDAALARSDGRTVPAEVSRLVQPFEDPVSPQAIRSLHGLKRYLHQRGLRLAFRLVQSGRAATRRVTIAVGEADRALQVARAIEYADFEPNPTSGAETAPYAVRVVVEGFARQLLHGQERLPSVRVFCYGNEVHYFVSFRNHPAFVRIDYSPPFAGGMIDLEYYGVSKYELSNHPDISLEGIRTFFERLDFDVTVDNTRIHARYDKERARDLRELCGRVEALFRLAPYLMDVDWVLGGLDLSAEARDLARHAWADRFARWGVLPLQPILTEDRRAILLRDRPHPAGPREQIWQGDAPYRDRLTPEGAAEAAEWIRQTFSARGLDLPIALEPADVAQIPLEAHVLGPLRESGLGAGQPHEASRLAALIRRGDQAIVAAARLARLLGPIDRFLQFQSVGSVNGHTVQRCRIVFPGQRLSVAVLRHSAGEPGLALADDPANGRYELDAMGVASLLRAHNYPVGDTTGVEFHPARLVRAFSAPGSERVAKPVEGERLTNGVRAAPGIAAGLARFGTAHRSPRDLEGAVLVTDRLSPDEGPFLVRAAAVVCTGGGVLSHAGLLAAQFGKPAIVIAGSWTASAGAGALLRFWSADYDETTRAIGKSVVVERRGFRRREEWLRDGDLVEVAADEGVLRVLGQDRETLALHDALRQLAGSEARLAATASPDQILVERGRRAHAFHQLQRLLVRLERPDLVAFSARRLLGGAATTASVAGLLRAMLEGPAAAVARVSVIERLDLIATRCEEADRIARERIPVAADAFEVIALRLAAARAAETLRSAGSALSAVGPQRAVGLSDCVGVLGNTLHAPLDEPASARLSALQAREFAELRHALETGASARARHLLEAIERTSALVGAPLPEPPAAAAARREVGSREAASLARCARHRFLTSADGGAELAPLIGAKAANLAEVAQLDADLEVPPWFALTHAAFEEVLACAVEGGRLTVREAIAGVLSRSGVDDRQRSRAIAAIWERLAWPAPLEQEVRAAYRELSTRAGSGATVPRTPGGDLLVAVRSSALEEDRPEGTRAGEFDTFLFVAGEESLLSHITRAWSGLWTPRAIRNRAMLGADPWPPGGGVLVQRVVDARTAGVVQTINVADGRPWELAIDVAFGLGEGIVSGRVAADHATVAKRERSGGGLILRYATADKRERVVFDARRGSGTIRAETLYHQRMRPALEYAELEELVSAAERLERAWRQALDIEFAFDARQLWILQARPVPAFHAAWRLTGRRYPFAGRREES